MSLSNSNAFINSNAFKLIPVLGLSEEDTQRYRYDFEGHEKASYSIACLEDVEERGFEWWRITHLCTRRS